MTVETTLKNICAKISLLLEILAPKEETVTAMRNVAIPAGRSAESQSITNEGYEYARVFIGVRFSDQNTGPVIVDLYFGPAKVGELIKVPSQRAGAVVPSLAIDIDHLASFSLLVRNSDTSQAVNVADLRVVLWR